MPGLVVNQSEVIVGANAAARNLIGQRIEGRPYVTMLRQPALLDAVEACLRQGKTRTAPYLTNDGSQHSTFSVHVAQVMMDKEAPMVLLSFEDVTQVQAAGQMRRDEPAGGRSVVAEPGRRRRTGAAHDAGQPARMPVIGDAADDAAGRRIRGYAGGRAGQ